MPHDKNDRPLAVGDRVTVTYIIKSIATNPEYCNLTLETVEPMFPDEHKTTICLNAKQVIKLYKL